MAKINTYGIKMTGLRAAAGETKTLKGYYGGQYVQINYDTSDGRVLTRYHVCSGTSSWTVYHCPDIIHVGNLHSPATMQDIANMVRDALPTK